VANETLVSSTLTRRVHDLNKIERLRLFVLVPATPASDDGGIDRAITNLYDGIALFENMGITVEGRVGQADPMAAIEFVLSQHAGINLVLISTLPLGVSRWISMDLPHRVYRRFGIAMEHIEGPALDLTSPRHTAGRPIKVLLVEDNQVDIDLARAALDKHEDVDLLVARDGEDAVRYMAEASPRPDLILVDIKMPKMNGFEMLDEFMSTLGLDNNHELNIVVVSSSADTDDRVRARANGANAYIVKDPDFDRFEASLDSIVSEVRSEVATTG